MGDCLKTGKPSQYIISTKVNSAFHPFRVGKTSTIQHGSDYSKARSPVSSGCMIPYSR